MYEALKDQLANAKDAVRIGEVNQDATSGNITGRGMGFINKFKELAEADGKKVAVVGNEYYVNLVENNAKEADAEYHHRSSCTCTDNSRTVCYRSF